MCAPHLGVVSGRQTRPRAGWWFAGLALLAVLGLGNLPLWTGRAAPQWDAADFFGPAFSLLGDEIRSGHLLKWNPWTSAGTPDWAEPEFGAASPIHLAAAFLAREPQSGYIAFWLAVWCFGGIGMLVLARHLGAPPAGAAIASVGFAASGFYTGHAEHLSWIYAVSFLPWVVWRLDVALLRSDSWCAVQAGSLFGLSALGAYPAFTIVTPGFLFLWTSGRAVSRDEASLETIRRPSPARSVSLLLLAIACGALILSPPYVGLLTATPGFSDRAGPRPRQEATSDQMLATGALATFASPYLANLNRAPNALWPTTDVALTSVYTGAGSLVLAAFALRRKSAWRFWLAGIGAFFLCCALGSQLPLRGWLYDLLPPARYFRHAALFRAYTIFIAAILAALATRDLAQSPADRDRLRLSLLSLGWACAAAASFFVVVRRAGQALAQLHPAVLHLGLAWLGFAALAYLLLRRKMSCARFLQLAACLAAIDAAGALYLSQPIMYSADTVPWWQAMNRGHRSGLDVNLARDAEPPDFLGPAPSNRNAVLKLSVFDGYSGLRNRFQERFVADPELSRIASGARRLWFSSIVEGTAPSDGVFSAFEQRVHSLGQPVLILHSPEQMLALASRYAVAPQQASTSLDLPACLPAEVTDVDYHPDSLSFRFTAPTRGYLLVTDRWAPGWEVKVNGQPRPVLGGDFIFRAVEVEAGSNVVQFSYHPAGFTFFLLLSWGTMLLIAAAQCRRWITRPSHGAGRVDC